ncbi:MAG: hypothetical protein KIT18_06135 [Burkholderiales bacterium]|nr:hypothetical protein [Burkholderiales bacterium]
MKKGVERSVGRVPWPVLALLVVTLCLHATWQAWKPKPVAHAAELGVPPPLAVLRAASLGEPIVAAQLLTLYLQAFDNQPGISIPFLDLDYPRVIGWLDTILGLDPLTEYPLLMASQLYGQVPDEARRRLMFEFVHRKFLEDPDRRWRWLAHCAILAKHRLNDQALALRYAEDITRHARAASNWARQMRIFILEDMGELESATILLGGLLASGEVTDPREIHFLTQRLNELKALRNDEKSSPSTKSRQ